MMEILQLLVHVQVQVHGAGAGAGLFPRGISAQCFWKIEGDKNKTVLSGAGKAPGETCSSAVQPQGIGRTGAECGNFKRQVLCR